MEPFKNLISIHSISPLLEALIKVDPRIKEVIDKIHIHNELSKRELKARIEWLSVYLYGVIDGDYDAQITKLKKVILGNKDLRGFPVAALPEFTARFGIDHPETSLQFIAFSTERFSGEFAIRYFLNKHFKFTLKKMHLWAKSDNVHIRRLASEGSRPNLPWGIAVSKLKKNPELTLKILETLYFDDEIYVRKSVANHLNDISKINKNIVFSFLKNQELKAKSANKIKKHHWIVKHSLRWLIKRGDPGALKFLGAHKKPEIEIKKFLVTPKIITKNENLQIELIFKSRKKQTLMIDLVWTYPQKTKQTRKIFKWKLIDCKPSDSLLLKRSIEIKDRSIRKLFFGKHHFGLQINGIILSQQAWTLRDPYK